MVGPRRRHLFPHELYSTQEPATTTGPPPPARFRSAPHEFYDGSIMTTTPTISWYRNGGFGGVPASADAIAGLPLTTVDAGEAAVNDRCAVCHEGYEAGDRVRTMPCAHGFHEGCIVGWLFVSRLCPLCRFKLPTETEQAEEEERAAAARLRRRWSNA
ncbi:hypothetical protein QOZ80_9BG0697920 [Eleusine coracana subsp. coracana]|nr:hypothetical protein QOZ80_9BG0697920 [Eleusine coracana subsp. coracana]